MNTVDFTEKYYVNRTGTDCCKWDGLQEKYGSSSLLPMWVADMDFQVPEAVTKALQERVFHGVFGYTLTPASYLEAFCEWERCRHGVNVEKDWIRFSPGVVTGIYWCVQAFTGKEDAVIVNTPVYYPFQNAVKDLGRKLICNELVCENGYYTIDFEAFEQQIAKERVKLFILCSPHNPISRVWKEGELETLLSICEKYGVMVISDEIHQDFVFGEARHMSALNIEKGRYRELLILMTAASKTFNIAGLKNAFIVIPSEKNRAVFDDFSVYPRVENGSIFGYTAVEAAYRNGAEWLENLKNVIYENYEYVKEYFSIELPKAIISPLEGTYLMWIDLGVYIKEQDMEEAMEKRAGVAVDYGSWFSDKWGTCIRLNLGTSMENVKRAAEGIVKAAKEFV